MGRAACASRPAHDFAAVLAEASVSSIYFALRAKRAGTGCTCCIACGRSMLASLRTAWLATGASTLLTYYER